MRERPTGEELLKIARDVLKNELLPLLPKDKSYQALMIANAMSIAERQLQQGSEPQQKEQEVLSMLLKKSGDLSELNKELAKNIRQGVFDENSDVMKFLWEQTVQRVRESAPKVLSHYQKR